jgi:hypothetical protein
MTQTQAKRLSAKFNRIRKLADEAAALFGDDPLEGDLFTAVNNITAAADWALEALDRPSRFGAPS